MERSTIIRKLMEDKGMKVSDVSKESGIAYSTVKSILENGIGKASYVNICKICESVGITADKLEDMIKNNKTKKPELSKEDYERIRKYKLISEYSPDGASVVDTVLDREYGIADKLRNQTQQLQEKDKRIAELEAASATVIELPSQPGTRHLVEYFRNASAGSGIFILGNEAASRIAVADQDWDDRTDYVIRVNGDSMAPDYNDGDNVLVSQRIELRHGDVGIFIVNGSSFIKEYGEKELISRNPAFQNIQVHEFDNIVCMGKVIGTIRGKYQVIND